MNFLELAKKRYSVRSYSEKPIEKEKLDTILEAGRIAPSAVNYQPTKIIVVTDAKGLENVSKATNFYNAPCVLIVCNDTSASWKRKYDGKEFGDIDATIVTDHMMLMATELGLGTLWIGRFKPQVIKEEFNIPKEIEPINLLAIGYADGEAKSPDRHDKDRKALSDIILS